jgi:hypothetical protein
MSLCRQPKENVLSYLVTVQKHCLNCRDRDREISRSRVTALQEDSETLSE